MILPSRPLRISRRRLLATGAGAIVASGLPLPAFSQAAARPVFTHGVQSGDVDAASGMVWTRVDRPARVMMEYATTESFRDPVRLPPVTALPDSDLAVKRLIEGLPSDQDVFYRLVAADLSDINLALGADRRPLPHRAGLAPLGPLRLVGRHRRPGLGDRRRGHEDLRDDGRARPRLLHPLGRRHLRRRPVDRRGRARRRLDLAEPRAARREAQGRRNPRRVPRAVEVQPHGRAHAGHGRAGADVLPVGRPRGAQQLVGVAGPDRRRPLRREVGAPARRPRQPRLPRDDADPLRPGRARPGLPQDRLRAAARRVLRRPALVPRPEHRAGGGRAHRRDPHPRRRPDRLAEARARDVARHLEGDRRRHADRPDHLGRSRRGRVRGGLRRRRRPAARARARDRRAPAPHPDRRHRQHRLADGRRALHRRDPLRPGQGRGSRSSRRSGSSSPARCTPAASARTRSTPPSGRRSASARRRRPSRATTCRRAPASSSSGSSTSTAPPGR